MGSSTSELASASSSGVNSAQNIESNLPQVHKIWSGTLSVGTTGLWRRGGRGEEPKSQGALYVRGLHHGHCWRRVRNWDIKRKVIGEIWFQRRHRYFPGRRPKIRPNGALRYFPEPSSCLPEWLHCQCDWGYWLHWRQLVIVIVIVIGIVCWWSGSWLLVPTYASLIKFQTSQCRHISKMIF